MSDDEVITIFMKSKVPSGKKTKKTSEVELEGYEEISFKYLKHLCGSWVKYHNGNHLVSGGFIVNVFDGILTIRSPALNGKENLEVKYDKSKIFYVKKDNENFTSLKELVSDYEERIHNLQIQIKNLTETKGKLMKILTQKQNIVEQEIRNCTEQS